MKANKDIDTKEALEKIADIWTSLNESQRALLKENFTLQS